MPASAAPAMELRGAGGVLLDCRDREILYVGPRGTGKSYCAIRRLFTFCRQYPGSRHLLCRQTRESMTESTLVTLERILGANHPQVRRMSRTQRHSYELWGSEIVCLGLDQPSKCYGSEWDTVTLDEAVETTLDSWESFGAVMRHNVMPFQQRLALTNPGPPGHWLNERATAVPPDLYKPIKTVNDYCDIDDYNAGPQAGVMRRLLSVHPDNPAYWDADKWGWTKHGLAYVQGELAALTGHRRARFYDGRWAMAEGSVYGAEFSDTTHTCPAFAVPIEWPVLCGLDPGYGHDCAFLWFTVSPTGRLYVIDEIVGPGIDLPQLVGKVNKINAERGYYPQRYYGDPQYIFQTRQESESLQTIIGKLGIKLTGWPKSTNIDAMVAAVRDLMIKRMGDGRPALMVFSRCRSTVTSVVSWSYKRDKLGRVPGDDRYEEQYKDVNDVLRGIVATNPRPSVEQARYVPDGVVRVVREDDEDEDG